MSGNRTRCLEASPPLPGGRIEQWPASRTHRDSRSSKVNAKSTVLLLLGKHCVHASEAVAHEPCSQPALCLVQSSLAKQQQIRHCSCKPPAALNLLQLLLCVLLSNPVVPSASQTPLTHPSHSDSLALHDLLEHQEYDQCTPIIHQ
jgi:hypothetical protein